MGLTVDVISLSGYSRVLGFVLTGRAVKVSSQRKSSSALNGFKGLEATLGMVVGDLDFDSLRVIF